ncbi:ester cyclase [Streptomyces griseus]|uniref:ester cyclase n=1 Tax=Streptomyces griseus TaxID=1911 RepID=UPI0033D7EB1B
MHANEQLVRVCLAAISEADAEGRLASYTDDAVSRDVPLDSVFADDRSGVCEWTMSGTLEGVLDGLPEQLAALAKGKHFTMPGATVYRFSADGRIQEESLYWDLAGVLGQFGLLPRL